MTDIKRMATEALVGLANLRMYFRRYQSEPELPPLVRSVLLSEICKVVIWTAEMHEAATVGAEDAFVGTTFPQWPKFEPEFWWFGDFDLGGQHPRTGDPSRSSAALLLPGREGLASTVFFKSQTTGEPLRLGMTVDRVGALVSSKTTCGWLAMKAFMETRIAALEPALAERGERRRFIKNEGSLPDVRIIQLRQREASEQEAGDREYHHKWIVKGHWRRLHEPRKSDGAEVTFVHAYVKGPQDAPLLQPRETIYAVAR